MKKEKQRYYFKYIIFSIIIAATVTWVTINFIGSAFKVEGDSMMPALNNQDRVIIVKAFLKKRKINRFDIMVMYRPDEPRKSIIKRVIGLPGEIIELRSGSIFINKQDIFNKIAARHLNITPGNMDMDALQIPKGYFFVIGDNMNKSVDSRTFGLIPERYIYGKTVFRYWPLSKFGTI